ncbi:MAG: hypothetical protein ACJ77K_04275 [Bacteroidia bacterium]
MNKKFKFLLVLKIIFGIAAFILIFGFGTMHLWNWLVPELFHGPIITFGQTVGLLVLCKILFGGFGNKFGRHHGHCGPGGKWGRHHYWKHRMHERFQNMSPEEKEKLKQRFKDRCRNWYCDEDDKDGKTENTEIQN